MLSTVLFFGHYGLLLLFGILLSAAFAGVRLSAKKNMAVTAGLFVLCGSLQLGLFVLLEEAFVWKIYPLIAHLPTLLVLCLYYRKRLATALAAVTSAYLCCQPAKWMGVLCAAISPSTLAQQAVQIVSLLLWGFVVMRYPAPYLSQIFHKDTRSVCIFGSIPLIYYLFDYIMGIYTDLWISNNRLVAEFLPFFLCIVFLLFCFVYYKEYEQKADAARREQIVRVTAAQQARELEAVKRGMQETRLLRHDMRLLLSSLAVCIENGDREKALEMIAAYTCHIDATKLERFCRIDTINYVLSDFSAKCVCAQTAFHCRVELTQCHADEILVCSILSNALDNALNAQKKLPPEQRCIRLMLKTADGKLLLSVKNPLDEIPAFSDGLPVADRKGHGYGTQSIRYMAERLGGNCQFTVENGMFVVRVVI